MRQKRRTCPRSPHKHASTGTTFRNFSDYFSASRFAKTSLTQCIRDACTCLTHPPLRHRKSSPFSCKPRHGDSHLKPGNSIMQTRWPATVSALAMSRHSSLPALHHDMDGTNTNVVLVCTASFQIKASSSSCWCYKHE